MMSRKERERLVVFGQVKSGELAPAEILKPTDNEVVKKTRVVQVLRALPGRFGR